MRRAVAVFLALMAVVTAFPAPSFAQSVGLRLLVQPWNPITDDDRVITPVEAPGLISILSAGVWSTTKPQLRETIIRALSVQNLIAEDVTLYDVVVELPDSTISLESVSGGGTNPLLVRAVFTAKRVELKATSTTPSFLGSWADPRCRAAADVTATVELRIGGDLSRPLQASPNASPATISVSNFSWDSENFPCDVIKEVVGLLGFEELIARTVARPEYTQPIAAIIASALNNGLAAANAQIAQAIPAGLGQVGAWVVGPSSGDQTIAIAAGVQVPVPDGTPRASIGGTLRMANGDSTARVKCPSLPLYAQRTAGPRRIVNGNGGLDGAESPKIDLATAISCGPVAADGSRQYTMTGLSSGFKNYFVQTGLVVSCGEDGRLLEPVNWPGQVGVPTTLVFPHSLTIRNLPGLCIEQFLLPETEIGTIPPINIRRITRGIGAVVLPF